jgi:hypothetical protein
MSESSAGSCDCERPDALHGVALVSEACPIHNAYPSRSCMGCGRIMSEREAREQGACDACRPDFDYECSSDTGAKS